MNFLLDVNNTYAENLAIGVEVFFIGVATVFSVLILIMAILYIFGLIFNKAQKPVKAPVTPPAPVAPVVTQSADDEIIAVIAAAIAMAESESQGAKFTVVSFKRI